MKNNSFASAMDKIVAQAETERLNEIKAGRRAVIMARVRKAAFFAFLAAAVVVAYNYRDELGQKVNGVLSSKSTASATGAGNAAGPTGQVAASLKTAEQNAATRDAIIDSMGK